MQPHDFHLGVIEGFYGKSWSWQERNDYADFLKDNGYGFYIYAPKNDPYLRRQWQQPWPEEVASEIARLAHTCREAGVLFGLGLSPYEIYVDYGTQTKAKLHAKVAALNELNLDILCVLFDDMRGDIPDLAKLQAEVVHEVIAASTARSFVMCPTYYSYDPILEKVFGAMPSNYLQNIGRLLDQRVDVFWTGPKVCSSDYPASHLQEVAEALRRKPFLWDNYPVNDSPQESNYLHLRAFQNRPAHLRDLLAGHAVNPMNQAWLSRIPLRTLLPSYQLGGAYEPEQSFLQACLLLCGEKLGECISRDISIFQDQGLQELDEDRRRELIKKYLSFGENSYAEEVVSWLRGEYAFDPAGLTE